MARREPGIYDFLGPHTRGLDLGRLLLDPQKPNVAGAIDPRHLIYGEERHGFLFGPTGTGKTSAWLLGILLGDALNDASVVITDPKGELAAMTATYRASIPGNRVVILDPFHKLKEITQGNQAAYAELYRQGLVESVGFNPMASLSDPSSPTFYDDAAALAEALIEIEERDSHWSQSAQGLVTGLIMLEKVLFRDKASLTNVRRMLTEKETDAKSPDGAPDGAALAADAPRSGLRYHALGAVAAAEKAMAKATDGMVENSWDVISSLLARFTRSSTEIDSIKSVADTQTRWLLSHSLRRDLNKPGIKFAELKTIKTTVYLIVPAERIRTYSAWLRMLIVAALRSLYTPGGKRTVFLLDEMPALGRLDPLTDAIAIARGFNVQIVGIAQDLVQLKALYKERYESLIANAGFLQFFTPNDLTTAGWMAQRAGEKTVRVKGLSESTKANDTKPFAESYNNSEGQQVTPIYRPEDLMGLPRWTGLLFFSGRSDAVPFYAPFYQRVDKLKLRAKPNPYAAP